MAGLEHLRGAEVTVAAGRTVAAWRGWAPAGGGATIILGVAHALVVGQRYHVGSFDDDGSYILAAKALAAGHGITSRMAGGFPLIGVYPLGYPALLSPLVALWPANDTAYRVLSVVLFVAVFPLTWVYLRRRGVPEVVGLAVLALLALNPVLATFATMVMPETAFLVVLLAMLLALDRWTSEGRTITGAGVASVVAAAGLLWLKEAGVGLVIGVVVWLIVRRLFRKALLAALVPVALYLPLPIMRSLAGANLVGSRYSGEVGGSFQGGLVATVRHVIPAAIKTYYTHAFPHTIVPTHNGLLPTHGPLEVAWVFLAVTTIPLCVAGFVVWCRRHPDAACFAVPVYLAETTVYPYINERRLILVLPVILAWYVLGITWTFAAVRAAGRRLGPRLRPLVAGGLPAVVPALVLVALTAQFTRDYLYFEGADSSAPAGSPYMALLLRAGTGSDVVETDYLWTTALYSGHRTANGAYLAGCDRQPIMDAIRADGAAYLLTASLNGAGPVDQACLLPALGAIPGAVRLYRASRDRASVFELTGAGTGHPDLQELGASASVDGGSQPVVAADEVPQDPADPAGQYPTVVAVNGSAALTWSWAHAMRVSQISLGAAAAEGAPDSTSSVALSVRGPDGSWRVVASVAGPVGATAAQKFLLVPLSSSDPITAARVTVTVDGSATVGVHDFHVLGPVG